MVANNFFTVEIVYASPASQSLLKVSMPEGSTVREAIIASGITTLFPEINLEQQKVGIFSKPCKLDDRVKQGDRIEIYRPLLIDPKDARRQKVKKSQLALGYNFL